MSKKKKIINKTYNNKNNKFYKPKILKISLNRGLGNLAQNKKLLEMSINEFRLITGQQPSFTYAKKAISGFKLRKQTLIGMKVTLRNEKMISFYNRLIHLVLPQIRDFKGFSFSQFDKFGNYNFGLSTQYIFPEINYELITKQLGLNISIITATTDLNENILLLKQLNFPFE